jgi:hypothetical protein
MSFQPYIRCNELDRVLFSIYFSRLLRPPRSYLTLRWVVSKETLVPLVTAPSIEIRLETRLTSSGSSSSSSSAPPASSCSSESSLALFSSLTAATASPTCESSGAGDSSSQCALLVGIDRVKDTRDGEYERVEGRIVGQINELAHRQLKLLHSRRHEETEHGAQKGLLFNG